MMHGGEYVRPFPRRYLREKLAAQRKAAKKLRRRVGLPVKPDETLHTFSSTPALDQGQPRKSRGWSTGSALGPKLDTDLIREIHSLEADVEPHFSSERIDDVIVDIAAGVRDLYDDRHFDWTTLRLEMSPEDWYERGENYWEPEEPTVISDIAIHRGAMVRERRVREAEARYKYQKLHHHQRATQKTMTASALEYLSWEGDHGR